MASTVPPTRGVAFSFEVPVFDTSGKLKTGAAFSASQRSLDGAAYGSMTNAPAEIGSSGTYTIALTAAEMAADRIDGRLVVSTASCQDVYFTIFTSANRIDDLATPAGIWTAANRTLTQAAAAVTAAVSGAAVVVYAATTWSISLTGLTDFTGWSKLYFTVKKSRFAPDSTALVQIQVTNGGSGSDGLLILGGSVYAGALSDGTMVANGTTGVTITLKVAASKLLSNVANVDYDVKAVFASSVVEVSDGSGKFTIAIGATAAVA